MYEKVNKVDKVYFIDSPWILHWNIGLTDKRAYELCNIQMLQLNLHKPLARFCP